MGSGASVSEEPQLGTLEAREAEPGGLHTCRREQRHLAGNVSSTLFVSTGVWEGVCVCAHVPV